MIVLDTNVVSEGLRPSPDKHVSAWLDTIELSKVRISVVTAAEMLKGVFLLPHGRRREDLQERVDTALAFYNGRVLGIDSREAPYFADIMGSRARSGRPIGSMDAWIAATCRRHDVPLVTRNVKDFEGTGIAVINPWDDVG